VIAIAVAGTFATVVVMRGLPLLFPAAMMLLGAIAITVLSPKRFSDGGRSHRRRPYRAFMLTQYVVNSSALLHI
jgi:hypothetical protein